MGLKTAGVKKHIKKKKNKTGNYPNYFRGKAVSQDVGWVGSNYLRSKLLWVWTDAPVHTLPYPQEASLPQKPDTVFSILFTQQLRAAPCE